MNKQETIDKVIQLIEQRCDEVIKINNLSEKENDLQYQWVKGIYQDMISLVKIL